MALDFEKIDKSKTNKELIKIFDGYNYKTIFEYKINEINNKPFYIKEYKNKYSLAEIKNILKKFKN